MAVSSRVARRVSKTVRAGAKPADGRGVGLAGEMGATFWPRWNYSYGAFKPVL